MDTEYVLEGMHASGRIRKALSNSAREIEKKVAGLESLRFAIHKKSTDYVIDLRAVSGIQDIVSSIRTRRIAKGLKLISSATIERLKTDTEKSKKQKHKK